MTNNEKQRIEYMRAKGESYAAISAALGISQNTVKSYCRRNNLGAGYIKETQAATATVCENCGKPLIHTPGAKKRRFCSDKCRMDWWANHPEAVNRKAVYHFTCETCGEEFTSYGNAHRRYCSRACYGLSRRASHE